MFHLPHQPAFVKFHQYAAEQYGSPILRIEDQRERERFKGKTKHVLALII
jgi:hypothetical protein